MPKKVSQFDLEEVFRQLRTNIEFSRMDDRMQIINVISSSPNEGKSTISINLARVCADKYSRVLLIDCDLRNPSCHRLLGVSNSKGLSDFLSTFTGSESIFETNTLKTITNDAGRVFYFLSCGTRVPNPLELLSSNRFSAFLQLARKEFDFIVIDCPPIGACSDGIPLSNASDGTLFAVSSRDTDKRVARNASRDLIRSGANIIGVCLTKVESFSNKHYYYYGYGDDKKKSKKVKRRK